MSQYPKHLLTSIYQQLLTSVEVRERVWNGTRFSKCFLGNECVNCMVQLEVSVMQIAKTVEEAVSIGNALLQKQYVAHVTHSQLFANEDIFYRFRAHEEQREDHEPRPWLNYLFPELELEEGQQHLPEEPSDRVADCRPEDLPPHLAQVLEVNRLTELRLEEYNAIWLDNSTAAGHQNPNPSDNCLLVVLAPAQAPSQSPLELQC